MMNKNLKSALAQGMIVFLGAFTLGILVNQTPHLLFLFAFTFGILRSITVYRYKKNIIEDERLISIRQKAQSIWFIVILAIIIITPELAIIYTNYFHNPMITLGSSTILLSELAWAFLSYAGMVGFLCVMEGEIMVRILMKSHEK